MIPNPTVTNGQLLPRPQLGVSNRLTIEFSEKNSVLIVRATYFDNVIARIVRSHAASLVNRNTSYISGTLPQGFLVWSGICGK